MSLLITKQRAPTTADLLQSRDPRVIAEALAKDGIRFERWPTAQLADDADQEAVLAAYRTEVARVSKEGPYPAVDVVRLRRDPGDEGWSEKARTARQKFLEEHTHAEDEVRFFVEGSGVFYLHVGDHVHMVLCEEGDLISVPSGTRHWFDMGTNPRFCAIRFFGTKDGWVASFTGDTISKSFPSFDDIVST